MTDLEHTWVQVGLLVRELLPAGEMNLFIDWVMQDTLNQCRYESSPLAMVHSWLKMSVVDRRSKHEV